MRTKEVAYTQLGLADPARTDAELIAAIAAHPVLLNRPIVTTPRGALLCRPPERVLELISSSARTTDVKEQATNESNEYTSTQRAKAQYVQVAPAMRSTKVSLVAACTRPHIAGDFYTDNQFVSLVTETPATSVYACSLFRITGSLI